MALKRSESELKLFPLHPENLVNHPIRETEDKDIAGNMAWFLDSEGDATMNGLLGSSSASDDDPSPTAFPDYSRGLDDNSDGYGALALTALRGRVVEEPERWVFFPRVVVEEEACSSNSSGGGGGGRFWCSPVEDHHHHQENQQGLSLKLDYEEVMNAWSDKGSLYIEGECPQTVPRHDDDSQTPDLTNVGSLEMACGKNAAATWMMVPDGGGSCGSTAEEGGEGKLGSREALVLRYKEKRQSRLFSKRIRYEVRKLNAEKRPRMKATTLSLSKV
ncbi:Zinc finger protein CONSTANS-LIKE 7 [Nymphaea thermarum]|nr:Zinc finger protein CONSTANS-LIKE 7 [Nymphaea thermarum]